MGVLLGPSVLNILGAYYEPLTLVGELGLLILVLEGGLGIDIVTLRRLGGRASAVAISGTTLPVMASLAVLPPLGFTLMESLAAGTALSSTAIGMAARMMQDAKIAHTELGQLICSAAMIDDVASLILLSVITNISENSEAGAWQYAEPLIASIGFVIAGSGVACFMPRAVRCLPRAFQESPETILFLLCLCAIGLTLAAWAIRSTPLLGETPQPQPQP